MTTNEIIIKPLNLQTIAIRLVGQTELITHAWSEKAKKQILDKQQKKKITKESRDPETEYKNGLYYYPSGGYGFPAIGIKQCLVGIAHKDYGIPKTQVLKSLFIPGKSDKNGMQLVKIHGEPEMREDMVTIGMGTSDLRYRPQFMPWHIDAMVQFNADFLSADAIVNLFSVAGFGIGLGEWRPERGGQSGMFTIEEIPEAEFKNLERMPMLQATGRVA